VPLNPQCTRLARRDAAHCRSAVQDRPPVSDAVHRTDTFNLPEPSLGVSLATAHDAGLGVIVKEAHANGRLTAANQRPEDATLLARLAAFAGDVSIDQLAIAFVAACPWVDCVLSGAVTVDQLASHVAGVERVLPAGINAALAELAEPPAQYWATRAALPWS